MHNNQPDDLPATLFYPIAESSSQSKVLGTVAGFIFIPVLILLAIAAPAILLFYPLAWLTCRLNGRRFSFDPATLMVTIDEICSLPQNQP